VLGTAARIDNPTSCPVQKIGQFSQGFSLACPSQVLRYAFLTIRGRTGGVNVEASLKVTNVVATIHFVQRIMDKSYKRLDLLYFSRPVIEVECGLCGSSSAIYMDEENSKE
jgi:hypothetical protein